MLRDALHPLIDRAWDLGDRLCRSESTAAIRRSIPILLFGDIDAYERSPLKVVTVGLNPSLREFPAASPWTRFPEGEVLHRLSRLGTDDRWRYVDALSAYFRNERSPYKRWFTSFDHVLRGAGASFYPTDQSHALHTDLMSPVATDPTWSRLSAGQRGAHTEGPALWRDLVEVLAPDAVIVSVARPLLPLMSVGEQMEWRDLKVGRGRAQVRTASLALSGHRALVVAGRCMRTPFGNLTSDEKVQVGRAAVERMKERPPIGR